LNSRDFFLLDENRNAIVSCGLWHCLRTIQNNDASPGLVPSGFESDRVVRLEVVHV